METRQQLYDTMVINPAIQAQAAHRIEKMKANEARYAAIMPSIPWYVVAVIHNMECDLDFTKYLGNGQSLNKVTTIVPKGRGPFPTFEAGAVDALKLQFFDRVTDWSMEHALYLLEGYNGYGYEKYHGIPSPYLWAGTNHYIKGKYTADGHYDPNAVSSQIGVAVLLKSLIA